VQVSQVRITQAPTLPVGNVLAEGLGITLAKKRKAHSGSGNNERKGARWEVERGDGLGRLRRNQTFQRPMSEEK